MGMIIGLTGGMGMGKSTVSAMSEDAGLPVIDTDAICHDLQKRGTKCYKEIVKAFGRSILNPDYTINRGKLRNIVFKDKGQKALLEKILHPRIKQVAMEQYIELDCNLVVIDAPLLFEAGFDDIVTKVLVVFTSDEIQMERVLKRNPKLTPEIVKAFVKSQMSISDKISRADYLIENSGTIEDLQRKFDDLLEKIDKEVDENA